MAWRYVVLVNPALQVEQLLDAFRGSGHKTRTPPIMVEYVIPVRLPAGQVVALRNLPIVESVSEEEGNFS